MNRVAGGAGSETDLDGTPTLFGCLFKCLLELTFMALIYLCWLKATDLTFDEYLTGNGVTGKTSLDASNIDTGEIAG